MQFLISLFLFGFVALTSQIPDQNLEHQSDNIILLSKIPQLILHSNQMTTGSKPIPEIQCIEGPGTAPCQIANPLQFTCINTALNSPSPVWDCSTSLPSFLRLGQSAVSCQGARSPDDPYIIIGSCGLVYSLQWRESILDISQPPPSQVPHIFLPSVTYIQFDSHKLTKPSGYRSKSLSKPQNQIQCLGKCPPDNFLPQFAIAYNKGMSSDGTLLWDVQFENYGHLLFSHISVVCPGLRSSLDPYILSENSCHLEYSLSNPIDLIDQQSRDNLTHIPILLGFHLDSLTFSDKSNSHLLRNEHSQTQIQCQGRIWKKPVREYTPEELEDPGNLPPIEYHIVEDAYCPSELIPKEIRCKIYGGNYGRFSSSWSCRASLPKGVYLKDIEIHCQGSRDDHDHWTDPRTCYIQFILDDTRTPWNPNGESSGISGYIVLFLLAFIFLGPLCYSIFHKKSKNNDVSLTNSPRRTPSSSPEPQLISTNSASDVPTIKSTGDGVGELHSSTVAYTFNR